MREYHVIVEQPVVMTGYVPVVAEDAAHAEALVRSGTESVEWLDSDAIGDIRIVSTELSEADPDSPDPDELLERRDRQ